MITGINGSKILTKHISYKCKCKFDGRKCNSNQEWNKDKYLANSIYDPVIMCDEIVNAADSVSTNVANNISANVMSTVSINSDNEKVIFSSSKIVHTVLLAIILLLIIAIICYHFTKQKRIGVLTI